MDAGTWISLVVMLGGMVGLYFLLRRETRADVGDAHGRELSAKDATIEELKAAIWQKAATIEYLKLPQSTAWAEGVRERIDALEQQKDQLERQRQRGEDEEEYRRETEQANSRIELLLEFYGTDAETELPAGLTRLHVAAREGHADIAELLLQAGADVNAKGQDGQTPLHVAAVGGHTELAKLLLEHGVDANASDKHGQTPLRWAAAQGHLEVAQLLLKAGADVNAADEDGDTPLMMAGNDEVRQLLRKHGTDE